MSSRKQDAFASMCIVCVAVVAAFVLSRENLHWFVVPIAACGFVVGIDACRWMRKGGDALDIYGLLGIFGLLYFLVLPLLYVPLGAQLSNVPRQPADYRPWLGYAASLNFFGLLCFYLARSIVDGVPLSSRGHQWRVVPSRFFAIAPLFLLVSFVMQVRFYANAGGAAAVMDREVDLSGMGVYFMVSESFPVLLFAAAVIYGRLSGRRLSRGWIWVLLSVCVALLFVFAGLRGSRSNFLTGVVSMLVMVNYVEFRIRKSWLILAAVPVFVFLIGYSLYKQLRTDILEVRSIDDYVRISGETGRDWRGVLLGDIGRANLEALAVYRLSRGDDYELAWGSTYVGAGLLVVPSSYRPRVRTITAASTEMLYGMGTYVPSGPRVRRSTRIFGLAGEAMLNFGFWGVPLAFATAGGIVAAIKRTTSGWSSSDVRWIAYPVVFRVMLQIWHLDQANVVFAIIKNGAFVFVFAWLISVRVGPIDRVGSGRLSQR